MYYPKLFLVGRDSLEKLKQIRDYLLNGGGMNEFGNIVQYTEEGEEEVYYGVYFSVLDAMREAKKKDYNVVDEWEGVLC